MAKAKKQSSTPFAKLTSEERQRLHDDWWRSRQRWLSGETDASGALRVALPAPAPTASKARKDRATPALNIARRILAEIYPGQLIPGGPVKILRNKVLARLRQDEKPMGPDSVAAARDLHNQDVRSRP